MWLLASRKHNMHLSCLVQGLCRGDHVPAVLPCAALPLFVLQGKFKPLKFTCKHRQLLLTDLFQCMAAASAMGRCLVAAKVLG